MQEENIHNYKRRLETTYKRVMSYDISEDNKKLIKQFHDNCFTEGLSLSKIDRYLFDIGYYARIVKKPLMEVSKDEIKGVVAEIAKELGAHRSAISRILLSLEKEGLVKCVNPQDKSFRHYIRKG